MSDTPQFSSASAEFTQDGNTVGTTDEMESIRIDLVTQLPGEEPFIVIRTSGWSINSIDEMKMLIDKVMLVAGKVSVNGGK